MSVALASDDFTHRLISLFSAIRCFAPWTIWFLSPDADNFFGPDSHAKTDDVHIDRKGAGHSMATTRKNWHAMHRAQLTFGQRIADTVAATMGSWSFIIVQSVILTVWIILNVIAWISHWDPYPFILLNLALSFQAAYAAPFIMISQNRQTERDRHQAEEDFRTNIEAEQRIEELQRQLATIEVNKLDKIVDLLEKRLPAKLAQ
jgi:uncharacterized membrane protein